MCPPGYDHSKCMATHALETDSCTCTDYYNAIAAMRNRTSCVVTHDLLLRIATITYITILV